MDDCANDGSASEVDVATQGNIGCTRDTGPGATIIPGDSSG